ncbi:hypothetical protein D3C85_1549060 [compost metagenome]
MIAFLSIPENNRRIINNGSRLNEPFLQGRQVSCNRLHRGAGLSDHLGSIVHLLGIEVSTFDHAQNTTCSMIDHHTGNLFQSFCLAVRREVAAVF